MFQLWRPMKESPLWENSNANANTKVALISSGRSQLGEMHNWQEETIRQYDIWMKVTQKTSRKMSWKLLLAF